MSCFWRNIVSVPPQHCHCQPPAGFLHVAAILLLLGAKTKPWPEDLYVYLKNKRHGHILPHNLNTFRMFTETHSLRACVS